MVFIFITIIFLFFFTLSVSEKFKNSIFEIPVISQTLSTNSLRTTSEKPINLHTIRKLIEYIFKNYFLLALFTPTVVEILLFKCRSVLPPAQRGTVRERVKKLFLIFTIFIFSKYFFSIVFANIYLLSVFFQQILPGGKK